ncbi:MAG: hypothetical protein U9N35_00370 [Euryarchaeota archaeon]|nr:hypothetical protein [Euryarchaeota archaeon]
MQLPKGTPKRKIKEENFHLCLGELKKRDLEITTEFSGYIRVFGRDFKGTHDDYRFIVEKGDIIAAERVELEEKTRTMGDNVFDEIDLFYEECIIQTINLESSQIKRIKKSNKDCLLLNAVKFANGNNRGELLRRMNTDNASVDKFLSKFGIKAS